MKPLSAPRRVTRLISPDATCDSEEVVIFQEKKKVNRRASGTTPPVPHQIDISKTMDTSIPMAEPSPVSSLRQVMNPYLKGSNPATPQDLLTSRRDSTMHTFESETRGENNRKARGFSPNTSPRQALLSEL